MTPSPLRIVSLISSATEMLYALGLGNQVVAVSHECDWPPEIAGKPRATISNIDTGRPSSEIDQQVKQKLAAGEPLYGIDADLIASLRPDLIVTQAQCDVCAVRLDDVRAMIATRPELQATKLVSLQPNRLGDIFQDLLRLGDATGQAAAAERFVAKLKARVDRVQQRVAGELQSQARRRVAIIEWTEPLMLAANWTPELVAIAGGDCPLTIAGEHSGYHAWPAVAAFDPEVIVVAPCGFDLPRSIHEARSVDAVAWLDKDRGRWCGTRLCSRWQRLSQPQRATYRRYAGDSGGIVLGKHRSRRRSPADRTVIMSGSTPQVIVLGSINTDLVTRLPRLPEPGMTMIGREFFQAHGGKGANQAVAAARAGLAPVVLIAAVGDDEYGRASLANLAHERLVLDYVQRIEDCPSGVAFILVEDSGENCIAVTPGANRALAAGAY